MTDNVKECHEKFVQVLSLMTPQRTVSDDTFLEKIQSYLTFEGKMLFNFLISSISQWSTKLSPQNTTTS